MRIVQIIDSLEAGGAERMAVNYANGLAKEIEFSGLIVSRKEGLLKSEINEKVSYLFLKKRKKIDYKAVFRLRNYLKKNKVTFIHAHSSSFFIAVLVKLTLPRIKIIWHDHYGISQDLSSRKNLSLKIGSIFFRGVISVNSDLRDWAQSYLWCSNFIYLPNFIIDSFATKERVLLKGKDEKRIICVANLRPQKNHHLLVNAANMIRNKFPDWTFHLFGKDFHDTYSEELKKKINLLKLDEVVFLYSSTDNVDSAIQQCQIGVLPSLSEGLPLAILEYGRHALPVIATNVGEISKVIMSQKEGLIVESNDVIQFVEAVEKLILNENLRKQLGETLNHKVQLNFSEKNIIAEYLLWLKSLTILAV
jgi:glycosyltransferase involved in cell wall biosynthesis